MAEIEWIVSFKIHLDLLEASNEAIEKLEVIKDKSKRNLLPIDASRLLTLDRTARNSKGKGKNLIQMHPNDYN